MRREIQFNYIAYINVRSVSNIRYLFIFLCFIYSSQLHAQSDSIGSQLKAFHEAVWNQDNFNLSSVESYLSKITELEIEKCSDSTKYYYHYFKAGIFGNREQVELEREHLQKAITLREKSIGILDPEYIELLSELGSISEKSNVDKAISYYQKSIVIGQTILYNKEIPPYNTSYMQNTFGMILSNLARMYENKKWYDKLPKLYEFAFSFRSRFYDVDDPTCFVDLYLLARYYKKQNKYDKVVETYQRVVNYLNNNGGYGTNSYVNASYMLAAALSRNEQSCEALDLYKKTIRLTLDSLDADNKNLDLLYSNYCIELANNNSFDELNKILPEVHQFYQSKRALKAYVDILYTISSKLYEKKMYDKADYFIDSLFNYSYYLPDVVLESLYSQKAVIELDGNHIPSAIQWKQRQIEIESKIGISDSVYHLSLLSELATLNSNIGNYNEALSIYEQVLDGLRKEKLEEHNLYEQCVFFVCNLYHNMQKESLHEMFLNTQRDYMENKKLTNSHIYAQLCNYLSVLQMKSNRLKEAFQNNKIAEALFLKHDGRKSTNYATVLHNKGRILMLRGKNKKALKNLLESKQLQLELNGTVSSNTHKYIQELENNH